MATKERATLAGQDHVPALPPEVEGGTLIYEGFGRVIDNLLGDSRMRRAAKAHVDSMFARDEVPDDPPPAEPAPAVPDGTQVFTEADPGQR